MRLLMILATIADIGMLLLLLAVSGFVLQGVNNTGPQMPDALWFGLIVLATIACPIAAWIGRARLGPGWSLAIAAAPPVGALLVIFLESFLMGLGSY